MDRDACIGGGADRPVLLIVGTLEHSQAAPAQGEATTATRMARCASVGEAALWLRGHWADAIIVEAECLGGQWADPQWLRGLHECAAHASVVLVGDPSGPEGETAQGLAGLFAAGLADWVCGKEWRSQASVGRAARWIALAAERRAQGERARLVEAVCARMTQERRSLETRLGKACADLARERADAAGREAVASMRAECAAVLAQEVEQGPIVEWSLQYFIARVGPANAAVFVREQEAFKLCGYVRDDLSRRAAGGVLDHLATGWCQGIASQQGVVRIADQAAVAPKWVELQGVLPGRSVLAFPCVQGEVAASSAVVIAFRDGKRPFGPDLEHVARALGPALGGALARTRRVLGRMQPQWPRSPKDQPKE